MAAGVLSPPGSEYGPCDDPCAHIDCEETRRMAAARCTICDRPIGYNTRFYVIRTGDAYAHAYAHAACEEDRIFEAGHDR